MHNFIGRDLRTYGTRPARGAAALVVFTLRTGTKGSHHILDITPEHELANVNGGPLAGALF